MIAGGADIRKITRSQLRSMDAPIRARGKKAFVKTKRKTGREQMIGATWINARIALPKSHNPTGKFASREDNVKTIREAKAEYARDDAPLLGIFEC